MLTEKQIAANRRNAKKSTGPRTEQGKLRASQNARTHGIFAADANLPNGYDDPAEFETRLNEYLDYYDPQSPLERDLVHQLVLVQLRLRRCARTETGMLSDNITYQYDPAAHPNLEARDVENQLLGRAFHTVATSLELLSRYESRLQNQLWKTIQKLDALRSSTRIGDTPGDLHDNSKATPAGVSPIPTTQMPSRKNEPISPPDPLKPITPLIQSPPTTRET